MKQGILITAYKDFDHLLDIASFFDSNFEIYIHIDKKSVVAYNIIDSLHSLPQVKLVSRKYKVNWGGINHLKCIFDTPTDCLCRIVKVTSFTITIEVTTNLCNWLDTL